jgi:hypothetical protein
MVITPTTDLTPFVGPRVCIAARYGRIHAIHHAAEATLCADALRGGVWGAMTIEPIPADRGGNTAFYYPYGTTVEIAEEN